MWWVPVIPYKIAIELKTNLELVLEINKITPEYFFTKKKRKVV